jgi:hypothetical protein
MDHNEALRLQAAEKYVMGELPAAVRDEYEDHYFECSECAADLESTFAFVETSKAVFRQEPQQALVPSTPEARRSWFKWLKPLVAVPSFAVVLVAFSYQTFVAVPYWKARSVESASPRVLPMFSLIAAGSRGAGFLSFEVRRGEPFGLYVDVPVDEAYKNYVLRLKDPAGQSKELRVLSSAEAKKTQVIAVDPANRPGAYEIEVAGLSAAEAGSTRGVRLATLNFVVSFGK